MKKRGSSVQVRFVHTHNKGWYFTLAVVVFFAFLYFWKPAVCTSESCFLEYASECKPASITKTLANMEVKLDAHDCVLSKTVVGVPEGDVVGEHLMGSSMQCDFKGKIMGPEDVNSLSAHVSFCTGPLRDFIVMYFL